MHGQHQHHIACSTQARCAAIEEAAACRGCSRHNDKDQSLEKKARVDAENRRQVMLSPDELKRELHCWVSHDARWMTFKAWVEVRPTAALPSLQYLSLDAVAQLGDVVEFHRIFIATIIVFASVQGRSKLCLSPLSGARLPFMDPLA